MLREKIIIVEEDMDGERLDSFLAESIEDISRSNVKALIDDKQVRVDGLERKASYRIKAGEIISVQIPDPKPVEIKPEPLPLEIIYQDSDVAVINKPKNMVVHPAHGNLNHTLVNALLYHIKDLSGINGEIRPGIVHRLDKDTSGVLVVAKNDTAHRSLAMQIKEHSINKQYMALVHGVIKENLGSIDAPIGRSKIDRKKMAVTSEGRKAISNYQVLERFHNYTLVKIQLLTGRTHQIRVHFAYIKHSIVGDPLYGSGKKHFGLDSQALHACLLGFKHPRTGEYMEFTAPLPEYFKKILDELQKNN